MSDFDFVLGKPKAQVKDAGYGVVVDKYPDTPVLTVHAVDATKQRQMKRMSLNTTAQNMLGLSGRGFEPTDAMKNEKVFFGTMRQDGKTIGHALVNYTMVDDDERGFKFNMNGSFASKDLWDVLKEDFGFDETQDAEFLLGTDDRIVTNINNLVVKEMMTTTDEVDDTNSQEATLAENDVNQEDLNFRTAAPSAPHPLTENV